MDGPTLLYVLPTPPPPQPGHSIRCRRQLPRQPQDAASEFFVEKVVLLSKGYKNISLKRMSGTWVLISLNSKSTQNKRDRNTVWGGKMPEVRLCTTTLGQVQKNNNLAQRKTIFSVVQHWPPRLSSPFPSGLCTAARVASAAPACGHGLGQGGQCCPETAPLLC